MLAFEMGCSDDSSSKDTSAFEADDPGECNDGADNNRDGRFDCADEGCATSPVCAGSNTDPDTATNTPSDSDPDSNTTPATGTDSGTGTVTGTETETDTGTGNEFIPAGEGWLHTEGNQILSEDGSVFRERGANIHDTRNCGACYNPNVAAVRAVEQRLGSPNHIIAVQGTRAYGKFLQYYPNHPITAGNGEDIVYEVHVYYGNDGDKWDYRWKTPAETLPVIIGEFAEVYESWDTLSLEDCDNMMMEAEALDIPWLAWTFHAACGNPLITSDNNCESTVTLTPTSGWGELIYNRLNMPWGSTESALP